MHPRFPPRLWPAASAAVLLVALATLTRLALALRPDVPLGGPLELLQIFARGLVFDLAAACYLLALPVLWLALVPDRVARTRVHRVLVLAAFAACAFGLLILPISEWLFWDEFGVRFNFIAVDYLVYTHEVLGNIWESYPVGWILAGLAAAALVLTALLARPLWRASAAPLSWRATGAVVAGTALVLWSVTGLVSSEAKNFSSSDAANELAGDGLYDFFAAERRNELDFERFYATLPPAEALARVRHGFPGADWVAPQVGGIERRVHAQGKARRLHVVLVTVESLGAEFLGAYGDPRGLTPNLDRLARESLWFTNVYATGTRTVRGLEAVTLAIPPTPGQSIVRRPHNETLFSLGSVFEDKGYGVLFAYGGYGYFDNMNAFFDANDYRSVDRRDIPSARIEFENIWGVADEHLFDQVIDELDREQAAHPRRPMFVHVMTTSNHRPYTYPPGRIDIAPGTGRDGAVKYTDYALGRFQPCLVRRHALRDHRGPRRRRTRHAAPGGRALPHPPLRLCAGDRGAAAGRPPHVADRHRADGARAARRGVLQQVPRPRRAAFAARHRPRLRRQLPDARLPPGRAHGSAAAAAADAGFRARRAGPPGGRDKRPRPRAGGHRLVPGGRARLPQRPASRRGAEAPAGARRARAATGRPGAAALRRGRRTIAAGG